VTGVVPFPADIRPDFPGKSHRRLGVDQHGLDLEFLTLDWRLRVM